MKFVSLIIYVYLPLSLRYCVLIHTKFLYYTLHLERRRHPYPESWQLVISLLSAIRQYFTFVISFSAAATWSCFGFNCLCIWMLVSKSLCRKRPFFFVCQRGSTLSLLKWICFNFYTVTVKQMFSSHTCAFTILSLFFTVCFCPGDVYDRFATIQHGTIH
jgi:hypothetical protein